MRSMVYRAPRFGLTLSLWFLAAACSGGGSAGRTDGDGDGSVGPAGPDAGEDAGGYDGACVGFDCATGQRCEVTGGAPACTGSCDDLTCAVGLRCEVNDNVGRCVPACEPSCSPGQRCERASSGPNLCVDNRCDDSTATPFRLVSRLKTVTETCAPTTAATPT